MNKKTERLNGKSFFIRTVYEMRIEIKVFQFRQYNKSHCENCLVINKGVLPRS